MWPYVNVITHFCGKQCVIYNIVFCSLLWESMISWHSTIIHTHFEPLYAHKNSKLTSPSQWIQWTSMLQLGLPLGKALPRELYPTHKWGTLWGVRNKKMLLEMKFIYPSPLARKITLDKCASLLHTRFLQVLSLHIGKEPQD